MDARSVRRWVQQKGDPTEHQKQEPKDWPSADQGAAVPGDEGWALQSAALLHRAAYWAHQPVGLMAGHWGDQKAHSTTARSSAGLMAPHSGGRKAAQQVGKTVRMTGHKMVH
mmetsp:Transcript_37047/g.68904  ORF Transcript_37047/g.68904 Transcript_37047/m.68904 type:complete len:112 (+) Transcript_37047:604-939(+)